MTTSTALHFARCIRLGLLCRSYASAVSEEGYRTRPRRTTLGLASRKLSTTSSNAQASVADVDLLRAQARIRASAVLSAQLLHMLLLLDRTPMSISLLSMPSPTVCASLAIAAYLLIVRLTRWRVYDRVHRKYAHLDPVQNPAARRMTPTEAQDIVHASIVWDLGAVLSNALSFAIVRTYAIPSISRILCSSRELKAGLSVSKRYLDTAIIAGTWSLCPISVTEAPTEFYANETKAERNADPDPRTFIGIARMNWLHAHYPFSNDDYLYTLSLFILEPVRWAKKYGWRSLSPLEVEARHVFYTRVGELMGIRDIPATVEELSAWSEEYEAQNMVPADTNEEVVSGMMTELSSAVPRFARRTFQRVLICFFDERTRVAMGLPEQPVWMHALVHIAASLFKFTQRHLLLPRLYKVPIVPMKTPSSPAEGLVRMHPAWPVTKPWYMPRPTGVQRILERVMLAVGIKSEDDVPGSKYGDEGYRLEELGPIRWKDVGHAEVMKMAEDMMGCPVRGVWAREPVCK